MATPSFALHTYRFQNRATYLTFITLFIINTSGFLIFSIDQAVKKETLSLATPFYREGTAIIIAIIYFVLFFSLSVFYIYLLGRSLKRYSSTWKTQGVLVRSNENRIIILLFILLIACAATWFLLPYFIGGRESFFSTPQMVCVALLFVAILVCKFLDKKEAGSIEIKPSREK